MNAFQPIKQSKNHDILSLFRFYLGLSQMFEGNYIMKFILDFRGLNRFRSHANAGFSAWKIQILHEFDWNEGEKLKSEKNKSLSELRSSYFHLLFREHHSSSVHAICKKKCVFVENADA